MADAGPAHKHTNRLVHEHSPYLLQHAHNPVDWYPWGEDAFSKAKKDDKPIFLSVGYSTCHWCHVMEVESFENEEVARYLNAWFVSIKVDREERPDVDKVYMTFVQASQGGGGWPMSVFLTPELTPIVGGTYFPPHDNYGRPGFKTVLRRVKESWESKKDMLRQAGDTVIQQLASSMSSSASALEVKEGLAQQAVQLCVSQLSKGFDPKLGGFGSAPKFPRPVEIILMLQRYYRLNQTNTDGAASKVLEMALFSLRCMARGGIHDHIGGGFHRYSVDEYWHVPHFEKMLYDQAQLVNVYLDAFSITANTVYASVARDTLDYLIRDMTHPEGGIYSAEDADSAISHESSQKKEGLFYVWTSKEIEDVLGKELSEIFTAHYNIKPEGNCTLSQMSDLHHEFVEKNVLIERQDISETANKFGKSVDETFEILGECRKRLHVYRTKRPRPHLDDKVIVAWNGLAMSSFARASTILKSEPKGQRYQFPVAGCDPEEYLKAAKGIAKFIKENVYDNKTKRLQRSFRNGPSQAPGFLDDYAFLIAGLIDLYQACGDINYLNWAVELQTTQDECFLDMNGGGYFSTAEGDPSILLRNKEDYDGAEPSANSVSALNLLRFSSLFANEDSKRYRDTAQHLLAVFEKRVEEVAIAVPLMCCAFDSLSTPKSQVVICGRRGTAELNALLVAAHKTFDPDRIVIQINVDDVGEKEWWKMKNRMVFEMTEKVVAGQAVAFVCRNFICRPPITDSLALEDELKR